jgi:uncharacterized protein YyaL (SSP411 family)
MLHQILPNIDYPSAYSNWLDLGLNYSGENKELAICSPKALDYTETINRLYIPNILLAGTQTNSKLPFLQDRFSDSKDQFYICQNKTCQMPLADFQETINILIKDF